MTELENKNSIDQERIANEAVNNAFKLENSWETEGTDRLHPPSIKAAAEASDPFYRTAIEAGLASGTPQARYIVTFAAIQLAGHLRMADAKKANKLYHIAIREGCANGTPKGRATVADAHFELAMCLMMEGKLEKAKKSFGVAIREGSASGTPYGRERAAWAASWLATIFWQTDKIDEGDKACRIAVREGNASGTELGKHLAITTPGCHLCQIHEANLFSNLKMQV